MRIWVLSAVVVPLLAAGCKEVECGDGTIERDGACVRADQAFSAAKCGPFTTLVGDVCVPMFDPTVCDEATTLPDVDPATGVTTCIGTGTSGCGAPIACPIPAAGKQTICGQLYDFENDQPFAAGGATGARCQAGATAGPCSLGIRAYDAISFGMNPSTATPLAVGDTYIDDCGRYRLTDITLPPGPFIGLGIDDAMMGPAGTTNAVGVATPKVADTATRNFEAFIATKATTDQWAASGGPPMSGGIYAMVFRAGKTGTTNRTGVTMTLRGSPVPANDFYFTAAETTRTTVEAAATVTGANGTALVTGASVADEVNYSGTGGLPPECQYSTHAGVALPFILFVQVLRPINATGMTCPL
jgi:hypothetical protein